MLEFALTDYNEILIKLKVKTDLQYEWEILLWFQALSCAGVYISTFFNRIFQTLLQWLTELDLGQCLLSQTTLHLNLTKKKKGKLGTWSCLILSRFMPHIDDIEKN